MSGRMDLRQFEALLDAHGADEERWPEQAREPARALLKADARARAELARARALEELLRADASPPPAQDLAMRILKQAGAPRPAAKAAREAANDNARAPWWIAAPLAASLLLGVWLGLSGTLAPVEELLVADSGDDLALLADIMADGAAANGEGGRL